MRFLLGVGGLALFLLGASPANNQEVLVHQLQQLTSGIQKLEHALLQCRPAESSQCQHLRNLLATSLSLRQELCRHPDLPKSQKECLLSLQQGSKNSHDR
jgi:hypothetical protein